MKSKPTSIHLKRFFATLSYFWYQWPWVSFKSLRKSFCANKYDKEDFQFCNFMVPCIAPKNNDATYLPSLL